VKTVFMGSPAFAVPCLRALAAVSEVVGVVSQPDKPKGRGQELSLPAVKVAAQTLGLHTLQPTSVRTPAFLAELSALQPELVVVVAYGKILPQTVLDVAARGCWNVHASILPKYRGAAPIQWAVMNGERESGVTLMQMDAGMDTGDMLLVKRTPIGDDETAAQLYDRLSQLGAETLSEGLANIDALERTPQNHAAATMAPMLDKELGHLDFALGAARVRDRVRGCDPWPSTYALLDGQPMKVFGAKVVSGTGEPGVVLGADRDGLLVGCGDSTIAFAELQLPGRKRLRADQLLAGRPIPRGTRLT
jgi:methionyl-tRNA formyltransferase